MARYPLTWRSLDPMQMLGKELPYQGVEGPLNENGARCPWPWNAAPHLGSALEPFTCPWCGGSQVAGLEHLDWSSVLAP